jgi:hypothetical protein
MHSTQALAWMLPLAALTAGCAGGTNAQVARTMNDVANGNYAEAAERCEWLGRHDHKVTDKGAIRYRVYCGIAYVQLGQHDKGLTLLVEGRKLYDESGERWLDPKIVTEMDENIALAKRKK